MALVKAAPLAPIPPPPPPESTGVLLDRLNAGDADERRHAAHALSRDPDTAPGLAARLEQETDLGVREALFDSLVSIGNETAASLIAGLLSSEDANLRGSATAALKQLRDAAVPLVDRLLGDSNPDIRILAVEVIRAWPATTATPRLRRVIEADPHLNVCGAAVDVATEVGTSSLLPPLAALRTRFAGNQFLVFAIGVACSRIHAAASNGE
jgi:HEAT repeat protein